MCGLATVLLVGAAPPAIFPRATTVRLYGSPQVLDVDAAGHVTAAVRDPAGRHTSTTLAPAGDLTAEEIGTLRGSVRFEPHDVAACFLPRHAFLFYDQAGRYLGHLSVCFECGGAEMKPEPVASGGSDAIVWDRHAIATIVTRHGLQTRWTWRPQAAPKPWWSRL